MSLDCIHTTLGVAFCAILAMSSEIFIRCR
jgi:hypothetical protein